MRASLWTFVHGRPAERGQAIVLVALTFTVLLLMGSVAIDTGRFVSERRFLQNAADAATLAGSHEWQRALVRGDSQATAETAAKARALEALRAHFGDDPTGTVPTDPADPPVYDPACGTTPACLIDGILVNAAGEPGAVRVALRNDVEFTFARIVGLNEANISARARSGADPNSGGPLPIAVRQFIQPPGPRTVAAAPCPAYDPIHPEFTAVFATAETSCLGSTTSSSGRGDASATTNGLEVEILGLGADPDGSISFRGFVAPDIRNFANEFSRRYYNGVTDNTNPNTLKAMQAKYFCSGYPGPPFPPVVSPPDPNLQIASMDGNSAGIAVDELHDCYTAGDLILVLVYDGIVKQIPQFDMQWPGSNSLGEIYIDSIGTAANPGYFNVSKNPAFDGQVSFTLLSTTNDPDNPLIDGTITSSPQITFSPNPATPTGGGGQRVDLQNVVTGSTLDKPTGATPGIYAALIKGTATSYSDQVGYLPLSINVGNVQRDFKLGGPTPQGCNVAVSAGDSVTCGFTVENARTGSRQFGGSVTFTLEDLSGNVLQTFASGVGAGQTSNVTISTSGLSQGLYTYVVRGTGFNSDGQKVTHLLPFIVNVAPASSPGNDTYVDITGYAIMEIVCAPGSTCMPPNTVWAKALTPVLPSLDDPAFAAVKPIRLLPWDY